MHGILPTKQRLYQIKHSVSPLCDKCNIIEDNMHMFINCQKVHAIKLYFLDVIKIVCDVENFNIKNLLYLDTQSVSKQKRNTLVLITSTLIGTIWYNRHTKSKVDPPAFRIKILSHHNILSIILKDKMKHLFTEQYCNLVRTLAQINCQ